MSVIHPSAPSRDWPALGAHVLLVRYSRGNVLNGDASDWDLRISGIVTETPALGSVYLSITPDHPESLPERPLYDHGHPESYTLGARRVTLRRSEFWQWTLEVLAPPKPAEPVVIEVGDRVSYVTHTPEPDETWDARTKRTYTVVSLYDHGDRVEAHCVQVIPARNRHNYSRPDEFYSDFEHLRLVGKASYAPVP